MAVQLHFHCVFIPDEGNFVMTLTKGEEQPGSLDYWKIQQRLSESELAFVIDHAKKQLVDVTDAQWEFTLQLPNGMQIERFNLHGINSRNVFSGLIDYLDLVLTSYQHWKGNES